MSATVKAKTYFHTIGMHKIRETSILASIHLFLSEENAQKEENIMQYNNIHYNG